MPRDEQQSRTSAEIYLSGNASATTCTTQNTWYTIAGSWAFNTAPIGFTIATPAGTLTVGSTTRSGTGRVLLLASGSISYPNSQAQTFEVGLFKNGSFITGHSLALSVNNAIDSFPFSINGLEDLVDGDVIDLRIRCTTTGGQAITVKYANISAW